MSRAAVRRSAAVVVPVVLVALLAAAVATGPAPAARGELVRGPLATGAARELSTNWAGYVATSVDPASPLEFTSVTGTWKQATAACEGAEANAASAFWVGIGGYHETSVALDQIGTSADCTRSGGAVYYAWYERFPEPPVRINLKIKPGDTITTSVNVSGGTVLYQLKNRTRRTVFTKRVPASALDLTAAAWIAEAPSLCIGSSCRTVPLADFGSVTFSRIAAIGSGHPGTLTDPAWSTVPIQLVPRAQGAYYRAEDGRFAAPDSTAGTSAPTVLRPDGRAFSLTWLPNATAAG